MGLIKDVILLPADVAKDLHRTLTQPARPREPLNPWPRTGDSRTRYGEKQVWNHGWQSRTIDSTQAAPAQEPNRAYEAAQKAAKARKARSGRGGRS